MQNIPSFCVSSVLLLVVFSSILPPSVALRLGVPVVMVCAVGAAGMDITIHGSLAEACTQRAHIKEGEGRSEGEVKKVPQKKKKHMGAEEKRMKRRDGTVSRIGF